MNKLFYDDNLDILRKFIRDEAIDGVFKSVEQARSETFSYIEGYYNRIRRYSSLSYLSPVEFEK